MLLRYPSGEDHWLYAANAERPFGYHDDSFAWATLDTGREEDAWFYMPSLRAAGKSAVDKWKTQPIGGEIRPDLWGIIFDDDVKHQQAQDFAKSVQETHASWLMDTGMMEKKQSKTRIANASAAVQKMGYEFYILQSSLNRTGSKFEVKLRLRNTGVAPFYYDWQVVLGALSETGRLLKEWPTDWKVTSLLPGEERSWETTLKTNNLPEGTQWLAVRVVNPLKNGLPLRFANSSKLQQSDGWFRVGEVR